MSNQQNDKNFHSPENLGIWRIGTSQENQKMRFEEWDTDFLPDSKIVMVVGNTIIKEYLVGSGLEREDDNKSLILTLEGEDFDSYCGKTILAYCNFFIKGNTEIVFNLEVIKNFI